MPVPDSSASSCRCYGCRPIRRRHGAGSCRGSSTTVSCMRCRARHTRRFSFSILVSRKAAIHFRQCLTASSYGINAYRPSCLLAKHRRTPASAIAILFTSVSSGAAAQQIIQPGLAEKLASRLIQPLGVSQSHPSSAQPYCLSWASMLCPQDRHRLCDVLIPCARSTARATHLP